MIGICTRYRRSDATLSALAVARYLDDVGRISSILCYDWRAGSVDYVYDNKLKRMPFNKWLRGLRQVVWTAPVDEFFLLHSKKRHTRNTLYTSWEQIEPYDERVLQLYHHVLVPTVIQATQLRDRFKLKNIAVLPFHCGLPITRQVDFQVNNRIKLCISLFGCQLKRVELAALYTVADIVGSFTNVDMTVIASKGLSARALDKLKLFTKKFGDRWTVVIDNDWFEHAKVMMHSDLTIWPAKYDGFGIVGLTSLHMGTPVLAWNAPPFNEHLSAGRNAILINCDVEYDWLGMSRVTPNYSEFDRVLRWLLNNPKALLSLREHTSEQLQGWDNEFVKGLNTILPPE